MAGVREITVACAKCGNEFTYLRSTRGGAIRSICDVCAEVRYGRQLSVSLSKQDVGIMEELQQLTGAGIREVMTISMRVYHAILTQNKRA